MTKRIGRTGKGRNVRAAGAIASAAFETLEARQLLAGGTWSQLTNLAPAGLGTMTLLTDGAVMVQGGGVSKNWYKLTPDSTGNYQNGTWSTLASMSLERLYTATNVMKDGRVFVLGGEYSGPSGTANWTNTGEIYNPTTNTWTSIPNHPQTQFGDDPSMLLDDGRIIVGSLTTANTYIYNPTTNTWATGPTKLNSDRSDEETWTKLPDGSVLSYNIFGSAGSAQRYYPSTNTWVASGSVGVGNNLETSGGKELGPGLMLPDGRLLQIGGNQHNAIYTPGANSSLPGSWAMIGDTPNVAGATAGGNDAPGAILPNGIVLYAAGDISTSFNPPTQLFEYDYTTNTITAAPTLNGPSLTGNAFTTRMLMLPTGQILFNNHGSNRLYLYSPIGGPQNSWRPVITNIQNTTGTTYTLTGTQLNGMSAGASYGDDAEMDTNYPIVRVSDGVTTKYARTTNWSTTGVQTGSLVETVTFVLPAGINQNNFTVTEIGSGIASNTVSAPSAPSGPTPSNGATGVDRNTLTLDWADSTNTTSYDVFIDNMTTPVANVASSQYTPSPVLIGGSHSWKVVANGAGGVTAGPTWSFSVTLLPPPATPSGPNHNGDIVTSLPVTLDWADSAGATSYDVYLGSATSPTATVTTSQYGPINPADGVRNWLIVAKNSDGVGATGPAWSYTVDTQGPTATYGGQTPTTGASTFDFTIAYADVGTSVNTSSFDNNDVTVTGPNSYSANAQFISNVGGTATYRINAPGGFWNDVDNGSYTFSINSNQVKDQSNNSTPAGTASSGTPTFALGFSWMSGSTLNVAFDGTTTAVALSTSGGNIVTTKNASSPSFPGVTAITVIGTSANDNLQFNGAVAPPLTFNNGTGNDVAKVNSGTYTFASNIGGATQNVQVIVDPGAAAIFGVTQVLRDLVVNGNATLSQNGSRAIVTKGLSIGASGKLDLKDNDLALDYTGSSQVGTWNGSAYTGVTGMLASGNAGGTWGGNGIVTSMSAATGGNSLTTLGVGEASDVLGPTGGSWDGVSVDGTTVLVKYTYAGDVNLDGAITGDDYFAIDAAFPQNLHGWNNGDLNYDGLITGDDYFLIDSNFPAQGGPL